MTPEIAHLPPSSPFAKAVFKQIRPHIPRQAWPREAVRASFMPAPDGFSLRARFDDFPAAYAAEAAQWVRKGGVDLVLASPAGWVAARTFRAQRWRDTCLYALVPLLFAIPLSGVLSGTAMRVAAAVFALDAVLLAATHLRLVRWRARLVAAAFSAAIPTPGLHLGVVATSGLPRPEDAG